MPLLLAFDTATRHCAVVLVDGGQVLASREDASDQFSHAERLNVFIAEVMAEAGRSLNELAAVAVGIGPGSYTGLRIGLSAAKGLCFALDKPLIGMSTLDVLGHQLRSTGIALHADDRLHPMIDARRMEVFTRVLDAQGAPLSNATPAILDGTWCEALPAAERAVVFGDGADKAASLWAGRANVLHVPGIKPGVQGLAHCAAELFAAQHFSDLAYLVPDYGKEPNVTQPKRKS